jgi:hypothetical protein
LGDKKKDPSVMKKIMENESKNWAYYSIHLNFFKRYLMKITDRQRPNG